jgi:Ca2+-binding EF-hand superfamily protein
MEDVKNSFRQIDQNGDGKISKRELFAVLKQILKIDKGGNYKQ